MRFERSNQILQLSINLLWFVFVYIRRSRDIRTKPLCVEGQERLKRGKEGRGEVEIERGDKGGKKREGRGGGRRVGERERERERRERERERSL